MWRSPETLPGRVCLLLCLTVMHTCALIFPTGAAEMKGDFYVAPNGDDNGTGTVRRPFATVQRAQKAVRALTAKGLQKDVLVLLRGGRYELRRPLTFAPEDGGTEEHAVTYAAYRNERPVFSGGSRLTGWRQEEVGCWTVTLPEVKAGTWSFRGLFVNGRRATRARSPDRGFFRIEKAGPDNRTSFTFRKADVGAYKHVGDAEIVFLHDWSTSRVRIRSVDSDRSTVRLADPIGCRARHFRMDHFERHPRYFVEGAAEMLDAPGEWHLDARTGRLTYIARKGETREEAEIVAPRLERVLDVKGRDEAPVRNLHLVGLTFEHTNWSLPPFGLACGQAAFHEVRLEGGKTRGRKPIPPAAHLESAVDCTVRKCRFAHLGGSGLALRRGCHGNRIEGCEFADIAANGVNVGEGYAARRVVKEGKAREVEDPELVAKGNVVANCLLHDCGALFYGAVGVWVGITDGTVVRHCEIRDLPYTGVSVGWRWDTKPTACANNTVEHNHIHHVMQLLSDGGGIYTLGRQPGTVLRGNHIHDIPANAGRAESNGMFLDQGTSLIRIEHNVLHSIARSRLRFHQAEKNKTRGNVLFLSKKQKPYMFNACSPDTMTFDDRLVHVKLLTTRGKIGRALKGDGATSHVAVPHDRALEPGHLTLEAWVKLARYPQGKDPRRWVAGKNAHEWTDGHYAIGFSGGTPFAVVNIGGGRKDARWARVKDGKLKLHTWHHLAMTYDGKELRAYLDGAPGEPVEIGQKRRPGRGPFDIGRRPDGFVYLEGAVDEVRLYRRALTEHEIRWHAERPGNNEEDRALVRHWDFEAEAAQPSDLEQAKQAGIQPRFRAYLLGEARE
jgi:hypothetical protein